MSADQIVADLLSKEFDDETKEGILNDFHAPPGSDRYKAFGYAFMRGEFGRWIRNSYGLWRADNPHVEVNPPPNAQNIIDHPLFPDNYSGMIIERFVEAFKKKHKSGFSLP